MSGPDQVEATRLLSAARAGDPRAVDALLPLVYEELRSLAAGYLRRERADALMQPTALVHEAFVRLVGTGVVDDYTRTHFAALSASIMRRVLVDHARSRGRDKRGRGWQRITLDEADAPADRSGLDVLALEEAMQRLAQLDPRQARIVELRFWGGLSVEEVAQVEGIAKRTVEADWTLARAWLKRELSRPER